MGSGTGPYTAVAEEGRVSPEFDVPFEAQRCSIPKCSRHVGTEGRRLCEMHLAASRRRHRRNAVKRNAARKARAAAGQCTDCGVLAVKAKCPGCAERANARARALRAKKIPRAYVRGIPAEGPKCSRCVRSTTEEFKMCIRCREDRAKWAANWRAKVAA